MHRYWRELRGYFRGEKMTETTIRLAHKRISDKRKTVQMLIAQVSDERYNNGNYQEWHIRNLIATLGKLENKILILELWYASRLLKESEGLAPVLIKNLDWLTVGIDGELSNSIQERKEYAKLIDKIGSYIDCCRLLQRDMDNAIEAFREAVALHKTQANDWNIGELKNGFF
jgi:hypothetical protein